jgi:membrane fusion protein (multidrug efflux system)
VAGPLVALAAGGYFYLTGGRYVSTDNAYVQADKLNVAADIGGTVASIAVHDNQEVRAGDVLFSLDPEPYRIALAGAEAQRDATRDEVATLKATYRQNVAQISQARTDKAYFETAFQRQQDLVNRGVTSQTAYDQAKRDLDAANERIVVAQRQAEATLSQLGGDENIRPEDTPRYRAAQALVDKARRDLDHTVVSASMDGVATNVNALQVGQYLAPAQAAFSLVATRKVWVEANPKETDLTYLKPDDPATVTIDTYPGREWHATVASIAPASGAEFAVLPAQNASGNWVKVVQRVPIRLALDLPPGAPPLRSGMSANVTVDTGHERSLGALLAEARRVVGLL